MGYEAYKTGDYKKANDLLAKFVEEAHNKMDGLRESYVFWYIVELTVAFGSLSWIFNVVWPQKSKSLFRKLIFPLQHRKFLFVVVVISFFFITHLFLPAFSDEKMLSQFFAYCCLFAVALLYLDLDQQLLQVFLVLFGIHSVLLLIANIVHAPRLIICDTIVFKLIKYCTLMGYVLFDFSFLKSRGATILFQYIAYGGSALLLLLHLLESLFGIADCLYLSYHLCFLWLAICLVSTPLFKATMLYPVGYLIFALEKECFLNASSIFVILPTIYLLGTVTLRPEQANYVSQSIFRLKILLMIMLMYSFTIWNYSYFGKTLSIDVDPDIPGIVDQVAMYVRAGFLIGFHKVGIIIFTILVIYRFLFINFNYLPEKPNNLIISDISSNSIFFSEEVLIFWEFSFSMTLFYIALFEKNFYANRHIATFITLAMIHATMSITFGILLIPTHSFVFWLKRKILIA